MGVLKAPLIAARGLVVHPGQLVLFVFGEAVLFDVFAGQFALGRAIGFFGRQVGRDENFLSGLPVWEWVFETGQLYLYLLTLKTDNNQ